MGNNSFTAIILSFHTPFHGHWIYLSSQHAPQPHLPDASVEKRNFGDQLADTLCIIPRLFQQSIKQCHHARSDLKSAERWTQWSSCLALWATSIMRRRKMRPGTIILAACANLPINDKRSRFLPAFLASHCQ